MRDIYTFTRLYALIIFIGLAMFSSLTAEAEKDGMVVRVGYTLSPPKVFLDSDDRPDGIFPDIVEGVAFDNDWNLVWVEERWPVLLEMLEAGDIDLLVDVAYSEERADRMNFNEEPVLANWLTFLNHADKEHLSSLRDLDGRTIAIHRGCVQFEELRKQIDVLELDVEFNARYDFKELFPLVVAGDADVAVVNRLFANQYGAAHTQLKQSDIIFEPVRLHVAASDEKAPWIIPAFDSSLKEMKENPHSAYGRAMSTWVVEKHDTLTVFLRKFGMWILVLVICGFATLGIFRWKLHEKTEVLRQKVKEAESLNDALLLNSERLRRYEFVIEQVPEFIWTADSEGNLIYCNSYAMNYTGRSLESLEGDGWAKTVHPNDVERVAEAWRENLKSKSKFLSEHRVYCAEAGDWHWNLTQAVPFFNEEGELIEWIGTSADIDRLRKYQSELITAKTNAEAANRAKSEFLAVMNHELRTPLNAIIGSTELLSDEVDSEDGRELLALASSSGNHLLNLITDILDLSRIEAGQANLTLEATPTVAFLHDGLAPLEAMASSKGVDLRIEVDESVPDSVEIDQHKFTQIMINLVGNAVKFTGEGFVSVSMTWNQSSGSGQRGELSVWVKDSGPGISEKFHDKIFEPFQQVDMSSKREFEGSGLGLAICKRLVDVQDGELELVESGDTGTIFRLCLPVANWSSETPEPQAPNKRISVSPFDDGLRILLVEDEPGNIKVFQLMLQKLGQGFEHVDTGEEAVRVTEAKDFDIIFMDVGLPGMDGVDATKLIRKQEREHEPFIVALTAHAMVDRRNDCFAAGMDEFLSKPVRMVELKEVIEGYQELIGGA